VIGAPFGENFGRGTGGTKKSGVKGFDQGKRLDPREQGVRPRRAAPPDNGLGRNRGGAKVQRHYASNQPAMAHAGISLRHIVDLWQTDIKNRITIIA
jgi:hypothetical protein